MKSTIPVIFLILLNVITCKTISDFCSRLNAPQNRKIQTKELRLRQLFNNHNLPANILVSHDFAKIKRVTTSINNKPQQIVIKKILKENANINMFQALKTFPFSGFLQCQFDDSSVFIALESYLKDLTDSEFLNNFRTKSLLTKLNFYADLFELVVNFGKLGFVHRHIQPDNCMLDTTGKPHLIDFDLVEISGRFDRPIGNPLYMSPTRFIRETEADPSSDLYSLAVLIFGIENPSGSELLMFDHARNNQVKLMPLCFEGIVLRSCLESIKANVRDIFEGQFGLFERGAGDEQMNFTTLILDILKYKSTRDGVSSLQIVKRLAGQQTVQDIFII